MPENTFGTTFGGDENDTFGTTFGSHTPIVPGDMENLTLKQVYTTLVTDAGITEDPLDTGALETYIEGLTVNPEVSDYDWSGVSVLCYRSSLASPLKLSIGRPCSLIGDTFAVGVWHSGPAVNEVVYFRTPAGGMASGTVAEIWQINSTDLRLIRFTADPGATLKRYPICTDASLAGYSNGPLWLLDQDQEIRLRYMSGLTSTAVVHSASAWENSLLITTGSGRPAFVATADNELILTGTLSTTTTNMRVSAAAAVAAIQTELDAYSETLATESLTDDIPVNVFGVRQRVRARVRKTILV